MSLLRKVLVILAITSGVVTAPVRPGTIAGRVMDSSHALLHGARIEVQPTGETAVTDLTYDRRGISARMGLTHNDAYIWPYNRERTADNILRGGERFPIQREYYSPTYSFGLRWVSRTELK